MDTAFLVADYAERGARFLQALAASPLGPAAAACWRRRPDAWDGAPGDWEFCVVLDGVGDVPLLELYGKLGEVERTMGEPRLSEYPPTVPHEHDPLPEALRSIALSGDRPRWVSEGQLNAAGAGGGVYMYPPALLGRPETPTANGTVSRPVAARAAERPPVAAAAG